MKKNNFGFTFVELIIVVIILGILSTVGFVSYNGYLGGSRDANRVTQVKDLYKSLQLYSTNKLLPLPDDAITITASGSVVGYQGFVGQSMLGLINYTNGGVDPKDNTYFTAFVAKNKKDIQIMTFLEETDNLDTEVAHLPFVSQGHAADLSNRNPKSFGAKLGILLEESTNTPAQDTPSALAAGSIDIVNTATSYTAYFSDTESISGTGITLALIQPRANCKRIFDLGNGNKSGVYNINPTGGDAFDVYCDMESDGGGWTAATMLADNTTQNLFYAGNSQKITSLTEDISTKGVLTNIWTDEDDRDIMIHCSHDDSGELEKYETPFFIYAFSKADLGNLIKQNKEGTIFSSKNLLAKWNNVNYILENNWGSSANSTNHSFISNGIVFSLVSGERLYQWNTGSNINSPAYNSGGNVSVYLTGGNFCMTFLR